MNIYVRYFDSEDVFCNADETIQFLVNINDFTMTPQLRQEITTYCQGTMPFPKRVKVRNNVYFILIKTTANNLAEFKANRKNPQAAAEKNVNTQKAAKMAQLQTVEEGWYKGEVNFKRVSLIPATQKCQYHDTRFTAYVYADSPLDCYTKIIEHLRSRQDVDPRSQFPSARGENYKYSFIGTMPKDIPTFEQPS